MLERYLADFLAFFFPQAHAEIDWHRGYTFLDKELQQVARDAAVRDSVGPLAQARTDANGLATLRLDRPGEWMVSAVHMTPCPERTIADWESLWASVTFELAAAK